MSNVTFEDIDIDVVSGTAITVDEYDSNIPSNASRAKSGWPTIRDIFFRRISGRALTAGTFTCIPERHCEGIELSDVHLSALHGFMNCTNVDASSATNTTPAACFA